LPIAQNGETSSILVRISLNTFPENAKYRKQLRQRWEMARKADRLELNPEMLVSLIRKLYVEKKRLTAW